MPQDQMSQNQMSQYDGSHYQNASPQNISQIQIPQSPVTRFQNYQTPWSNTFQSTMTPNQMIQYQNSQTHSLQNSQNALPLYQHNSQNHWSQNALPLYQHNSQNHWSQNAT